MIFSRLVEPSARTCPSPVAHSFPTLIFSCRPLFCCLGHPLSLCSFVVDPYPSATLQSYTLPILVSPWPWTLPLSLLVLLLWPVPLSSIDLSLSHLYPVRALCEFAHSSLSNFASWRHLSLCFNLDLLSFFLIFCFVKLSVL